MPADLKDDCWSENACNNDAAGICLRRDIEDKCHVSFSNSKRVHDLAANSMPMLRLILAEVFTRYEKSRKNLDKTTAFSFDLKLIPKDALIDAIEVHLKLKHDRVELQVIA